MKKAKYLNDYSDSKVQLKSDNLGRDTTVTLEECIKFSIRPEKLDADNSWYCTDCKEHVEATKTYELYKLPEILIIHLKRFKSRGLWNEKLTTMVEFPVLGLNLKDFVLSEEDNEPIYDLYGVSNHMGFMGGGHYTAFVWNPYVDSWVLMDDTRCYKVNSQDVVTPNGYILFYRRRNV